MGTVRSSDLACGQYAPKRRLAVVGSLKRHIRLQSITRLLPACYQPTTLKVRAHGSYTASFWYIEAPSSSPQFKASTQLAGFDSVFRQF